MAGAAIAERDILAPLALLGSADSAGKDTLAQVVRVDIQARRERRARQDSQRRLVALVPLGSLVPRVPRGKGHLDTQVFRGRRGSQGHLGIRGPLATLARQATQERLEQVGSVEPQGKGRQGILVFREHLESLERRDTLERLASLASKGRLRDRLTGSIASSQT